jgi:hypothetical protein
MVGWQDQSGNSLHATSVDNHLPSLVHRPVRLEMPPAGPNEATGAADGDERTIVLQRSTVKISADRRLMVGNLPAGQQVWLWFVIWSGDRFELREQSATDFATALPSALFHDVAEGGEVAEVLAYDRADRQEQVTAYLRAKYQVAA